MAKSRRQAVTGSDFLYDPYVDPDAPRIAAAAADDFEEAQERVLAFWTDDRLAAAEPLEMLSAPAGVVARAPALRPRDAARIVASAATRAAGVRVPAFVPPVVRAAAQQVAAAAHTTKPVADMKQYPYATVGKLFMTFGTKTFQGSAWAIGERAICTAGHCVKHNEAGGGAKNVVFQPAFAGGQSSGLFVVRQAKATPQWHRSEAFPYDIAAGVLGEDLPSSVDIAAYPTGDYRPRDLSPFLSVGYPAQAPFNGQTMFECAGGFAEQLQEGMWGMACNFTPGSSGGPIFAEVKDDESGESFYAAVGLNSWIYRGQHPPTIMHSPLLGAEFLTLVNWALGGGEN